MTVPTQPIALRAIDWPGYPVAGGTALQHERRPVHAPSDAARVTLVALFLVTAAHAVLMELERQVDEVSLRPALQVATSEPLCIGFTVRTPRFRRWASGRVRGTACVRVSGLHMSSSQPIPQNRPQSQLVSRCPGSSVWASMYLSRFKKMPRHCAAWTVAARCPFREQCRVRICRASGGEVDASGTR